MKRKISFLFASIAIAVFAGILPLLSHAKAGDMGGMNMPTTAPSTAPSVAVNTLCPVTKEPVDPKQPTVTYKGKVIGFCCPDCVKTFQENPDKYVADLK